MEQPLITITVNSLWTIASVATLLVATFIIGQYAAYAVSLHDWWWPFH